MGRKSKKPVQPNLQELLRTKLREKKLARQTVKAREQMVVKLEDKLEESKSHREREKLRKELELLEKVNEAFENTTVGEYAEYVDNGEYGGSFERPD